MQSRLLVVCENYSQVVILPVFRWTAVRCKGVDKIRNRFTFSPTDVNYFIEQFSRIFFGFFTFNQILYIYVFSLE